MNDRRTHMDMLAHAADSTEERDEVRRALGERLTASELDDYIAARLREDAWRAQPWPIGATNHAHRYSTCSACKQGLCQTPDACQRADEPRPSPRSGDLLRIAILLLACWAAVAATLLVSGVTL